MKNKFLLLFPLLLVVAMANQAQPDFTELHHEWMDRVNEEDTLNGLLFGRGYLLYRNGEALNGTPAASDRFNPGFDRELSTYRRLRLFRQDDGRYLTLGTVSYGSVPHILLTGWRLTPGGWKREIDLLLPEETDHDLTPGIRLQLDREREQWVRLANRHDPPSHIRRSYTKNAVYFSNGSRSDGWSGIADRYVYMKNPDYRVDLEASYLKRTGEGNVLEIGRYFTGSVRRGEGGIYVILWKPQPSDRWKIGLDYNF